MLPEVTERKPCELKSLLLAKHQKNKPLLPWKSALSGSGNSTYISEGLDPASICQVTGQGGFSSTQVCAIL